MSAQGSSGVGKFGALLGAIGFSALAGVLVTVMVAPAIAVTGVTATNTLSIFESLPSYIELSAQNQRNTIQLQNKDGSKFTIATIYDQNRQEVPLSKMSKYFQDAAISGEDRRFWQHGGVDAQSVVRAALGRFAGTSESGASTIAMQLVRNILLQEVINNSSLSTKQRTAQEQSVFYSQDPVRKLKEMKLAISLEKKYTKTEVLQAYLNIANFGANTYGVEAASEQYFNTTADKVTPAQAASIIAIVQNPSTKSLLTPSNYANNEARRDEILGWMKADGNITDAQYQEAVNTKVDASYVHLTTPQNGCRVADPAYRLFCNYIVRSVPDLTMLGSTATERAANWKAGGYTILGTLDPVAAVAARTALQKYAPPTEKRFQLGSAAATVQPGTGYITVMNQNKDFDDGDIGGNTALTALNLVVDKTHGGSSGRQPGSTYKPFTLINYLESGYAVNDTFNAGIHYFGATKFTDSCSKSGYDIAPGWTPKNNDNESGYWSVVRATAQSVNTVFIQMGSKVDQCQTANIAKSLGIYPAQDPSAALQRIPSCIIGGCNNDLVPLQLAGAYAAIANQGVYCTPIAVKDVIDPTGKDLGGQNANCNQTIPANVANTAAYAMSYVFNGGTAGASNPNDGVEYLGKTGTTDSAWDTWTVGSSTDASTAVWVGNISGKQNLRNIKVNGTQAAQLRHSIFKPIAQAIDKDYRGDSAFAAPDKTLINGKPTTVPDVTGQTIDDAAPVIQAANLNFSDGGQVDSTAPVGQIVSTVPAPGASVPRGTTVTTYESNGIGKTVPDVSSTQTMTLQSAIAALQAAGFTSVTKQCVAEGLQTDPQNVVIAQSPAAGAMSDANQQVTLTVKKYTCTGS